MFGCGLLRWDINYDPIAVLHNESLVFYELTTFFRFCRDFDADRDDYKEQGSLFYADFPVRFYYTFKNSGISIALRSANIQT